MPFGIPFELEYLIPRLLLTSRVPLGPAQVTSIVNRWEQPRVLLPGKLLVTEGGKDFRIDQLKIGRNHQIAVEEGIAADLFTSWDDGPELSLDPIYPGLDVEIVVVNLRDVSAFFTARLYGKVKL